LILVVPVFLPNCTPKSTFATDTLLPFESAPLLRVRELLTVNASTVESGVVLANPELALLRVTVFNLKRTTVAALLKTTLASCAALSNPALIDPRVEKTFASCAALLPDPLLLSPITALLLALLSFLPSFLLPSL
jgi:hypothetical protein